MAVVMNIIHGFQTICYMHGFGKKTVSNIMHGFETICFIHKMQNHDIY